MASVTLSGISSVMDRTLFTRRGPIVKRPLALLTGSDLAIVSPVSVRIRSASFTSDDVGMLLTIAGGAGARNSGTFEISKVLNSLTIELKGANFDIVDSTATVLKVAALANALKAAFNKHIVHLDQRIASPSRTHVANDAVNAVTSPAAYDLATSLTMLNQMRASLLAHMANSGGGFHTNADVWDKILSGPADSLSDAVTLANQLLAAYEAHRIERRCHYLGDSDSRTGMTAAAIVFQSSGSLAGPFVWTLLDPRYGTVADSPDDVVVRINGSPVSADAVFGMLGAVVLPTRPLPTDTVTIDYDYLNNPPARFLRLNSPEFVLNQDKNNGIMGFPGHRYRARSYLIDPGNTPDLISARVPLRIGWKYKAYEREYTAALNDPAKLLLNSPIRHIKYPVLSTTVGETTIAYDPTALPESAPDPWKLEGEGQASLADNLLVLTDSEYQSAVSSKPPFYTHASDIISSSLVSAAFRAKVGDFSSDGVFTGVGFGLSDGYSVALVGFIKTSATNLTSAISLANSAKGCFNSHLSQPTVHSPDDIASAVEIVDADDLDSLIILANALKLKYNLHLAKADPTLVTTNVHRNVDTSNLMSDADADDLDTAISLVNSFRDKLNAHRSSADVHFTDDIYNEIPQVMQVGVLTTAGTQESESSWAASAIDWTSLKTYRVYRDPEGNVSLYISGDVLPIVSVDRGDLPSISDFSGKFDPVQQVFFGSISREATSTSYWGLIRANISPLDSNLMEDNKSVDLDGTVVPEQDPANPWITLGHGGTERVLSGRGIQVESTCSASASELVAMGASSGAFRGYMRFEPMLSPSTISTVEFIAAIDYYTFSVGNQSHGIFIDDGQQSVHFAFLHYSPAPATVVGTSSTFSVSTSDRMMIGLDGGTMIPVVFSSVTTTAVAAAAVINAALGASVASDDGSNHVKLVHGSGASSYIEISGGSSSNNAAAKLGLAAGKYFGRDSTPEPRVSWFGENPPDAETVPWVKAGTSSTSMVGTPHFPVMRISDASDGEYAAFTMSNKVAVTGAIDPSSDWKLDARFAVDSFTAGEAVPGTLPLVSLRFCGALLNVDEGYGGKNVELHCSIDSSGTQYLNLVSYFSGTDSIVPLAQYAFAWNDGEFHSFNIFTNKTADQLFVYADGVMLSPTAGIPAYSALGSAAGSTPSVTFGSGSEEVTNVDLRTSVSTVDWSSVAIFRDSKLADPDAYQHRYVGIYEGGDPSLISSWNIASVDWSVPTTYRIVRNPIGSIAVYINGSSLPSISMSYTPITLPPSGSSFLSQVSNGRPVIAWGALSPTEISRGGWAYLKYSIGKLSLTDRIVPPHHVLNQANVIASPDHAKTGAEHVHQGFSVYSGGSPTDEFMADEGVPAYTILGESIPPVPKTQNLESRGGFVKNVTPASAVPAVDFVNYRGFLGNFENDTANVVSSPAAESSSEILTLVMIVANAISSVYETHRIRHDAVVGVNVHVVDDTTHVITSPAATDLPSAIVRLADLKSVFNGHVLDIVSHSSMDLGSYLTSADPTDLDSCVTLANEVLDKYGMHLDKGCFHYFPDSPPYYPPGSEYETNPDATDETSCRTLLDSLKRKFAAHAASSLWHRRTAQYSTTLNYTSIVPLSNQLKDLFNQHRIALEAHQLSDQTNAVVSRTAYNVATTIAIANEAKSRYNAHIGGHDVHLIIARSSSGYPHDRFPFPAIVHQLQQAALLANSIKASFNLHVGRDVSHVVPDAGSVVAEADAADLATLLALSNSLAAHFNAHRVSSVRTCKVHVRDDIVNVVSGTAVDLDSATALLNSIRSAYNAHRVQAGVHGSSAFIRIEPPPGVLYERMKFWKTESGTAGLVSPFSDDETWHIDAVKSQANKAVVYDGTVLPEKATVVSVGAAPAEIVAGDTLILEVDRGPSSTVVFSGSDTTVSSVVSRINLAAPGVASVEGAEIRITSPLSGQLSSLVVNGGTAARKLGFDIPRHSPWFVVSENPGDVTIAAMSSGGEDFLRYGVSGASRTLYASRAGYPLMPSVGFDISARIRVNSGGVLGGDDSGIFVGVCCAGDAPRSRGFVAAIGWGGTGSGRYVKLQDMVSGRILDRIPLDWLDGAFHTYNLTYDEAAGAMRLSVM